MDTFKPTTPLFYHVAMAVNCHTCRAEVREVIRVYAMTLEGGDCPICLQPAAQVCVFVPCGHGICHACAPRWANRLDAAPTDTDADAARAPGLVQEPFAPRAPPWLVQEPFAPIAPPWLVPEPFAPAPGWAPTLSESFMYQGRLAHWAQVYRFWDQTVLLWSDTGRLCRAGNTLAPPPAIAGLHVRWHVAGNGANSKWVLYEEVHEV